MSTDLKILKDLGMRKHQKRWVLVRCYCGRQFEASLSLVKRRKTRSCGCLQKQRASEANRTHGLSKSSEHRIWAAMKARVKGTATRSHHHSRGIQLCKRWESFENFYKDMGPRPSPQHTLERQDNEGNYEPSNCVWATRKVQNRNQVRTFWITFRGQKQSLAAWAEQRRLRSGTLRKRIVELGWSIERALTTPVGGQS